MTVEGTRHYRFYAGGIYISLHVSGKYSNIAMLFDRLPGRPIESMKISHSAAERIALYLLGIARTL